jgi:hypothetical protein
MNGSAMGAVRWTLRFEGLCVLAAASFAYYKLGFGWASLRSSFSLPIFLCLAILLDHGTAPRLIIPCTRI